MNAWPGDRSVLVMDKCAIHKTEAVHQLPAASGESSMRVGASRWCFPPGQRRRALVRAVRRLRSDRREPPVVD